MAYALYFLLNKKVLVLILFFLTRERERERDIIQHTNDLLRDI
jgi:hypothetical protein